jgi:glycosyltransferase involved in cell wall biosynthesis
MRLLIVVPDQERATGNWVTATRLQQGLVARGHAVTLVATSGDAGQLGRHVAAATPQLVVLLHAWRSGRPWLESGAALPYAVLLTGTDVDAGLRDPGQAPVIVTVLERAAAILTQNPVTLASLHRDRPELAARLHYLPPGIVLGTAPCRWRDRLEPAAGELVCLCPAGIRPVKGVVELLAMCDRLVREGCPLRLACCGPILDAGYGARFREAVACRSWATYLGVVPHAAMPAALRQADVVFSNAYSEGLPNALVEAATLGRPIVASAIAGHAAVVTDGYNGLLYQNESGFQTAVRRLHDQPGLLAALSRPDRQRFAPEREAAALDTICRNIFAGHHATCGPGM